MNGVRQDVDKRFFFYQQRLRRRGVVSAHFRCKRYGPVWGLAM
jgi:hypothetical protein